MQNISEQEKIRREKLEYLKEKGIAPFGQKYVRTDNPSLPVTNSIILITKQ